MIRKTYHVISVLLPLLVAAASAGAEAPFRFPEGKEGKGELRYANGLPILRLAGTPEDIGTQMGVLAVKPAARLLRYVKEFLPEAGRERAWVAAVATGRAMLPNFAPEHRRELDAAVKATGFDGDLLVAANTIFDIRKAVGCSVLMVERERSATGGPLFGRNLDFPTLGYLHEYSLVVVCRPEGKHAFVSVGFPALVGCLSGMNDAGLTLAVLEVASAKDGSPRFDPTGTPYSLCFRRILEACTTVAEAEQLLRSMKRTTCLNLAVCDTQRSAVFEFTPAKLVVRGAVEGMCVCTNHFRTPSLATSLMCRRYDALSESRRMPKVGVGDIRQKLHEANQGQETLQTMVFEPAALKLHLAIGKCPSSALSMTPVELAPLMKAPDRAESKPVCR